MKFIHFYCFTWFVMAQEWSANAQRPWVIAHRGASGERPEQTLEALIHAIEAGADMLEIDVSITKDKQLVVFHDLELSLTTDVRSKPEFQDRRRTVSVLDARRPPINKNITDWLIHDFTVAELKTLRISQRFDFRNQAYDRQFTIPTFQEVLQLIKKSNVNIRLLTELKYPTYFNEIMNKSNGMEDLTVQQIANEGLTNSGRVLLQSFDESAVTYLSKTTRFSVFQIVGSEDGVSEQLMSQWKKDGVDGVTLNKGIIATGPIKNVYKYEITATLPSPIVQKAHSLGMRVLVWTFRNEDRFVAWNFAQDAASEVEWFDRAKIDGFITDFPTTVKRVLDTRYNGESGLRATYTTTLILSTLQLFKLIN